MVGKVTPDDILSGSQLPAYLGLSHFQRANDVIKRGIDFISGNLEDNFEQSEAMSWGNTLEPVIAQQASIRLGLGNPKTDYDKAFFHNNLPLAVSLDASVLGDDRELSTDWDKGIIVIGQDSVKLTGRGCMEIKVTGSEPENEPPLYRGVIQLQAQMMCTQASWGVLCVLYKGIEMRLFVYGRNMEHAELIADAANDFKRRMDKYRESEEIEWMDFTGTKEATAIYDEAEDTTIELPQLEDKALRIIDLKSEVGLIHDEIELLQAQIMEEMKENKVAIAGKTKISWPMLNYKAQPEKIVPAKPAYSVRQSKLKIKYL